MIPQELEADLRQRYESIYDNDDEGRPDFESWAEGEIQQQQPQQAQPTIDFQALVQPPAYTPPVSQPAAIAAPPTPVAQPTVTNSASMTFDQAMQQFPGLYTEADRARYDEAQRAQQATNTQQNNAYNSQAPTPQAQQAVQQAQNSGFGTFFDLVGQGYANPQVTGTQQNPANQPTPWVESPTNPSPNTPVENMGGVSDTAFHPPPTQVNTASSGAATGAGEIIHPTQVETTSHPTQSVGNQPGVAGPGPGVTQPAGMTMQQFMAQRPDLAVTWNNAFKPENANDPTSQAIRAHGSMDKFMAAMYGGSFSGAGATTTTPGSTTPTVTPPTVTPANPGGGTGGTGAALNSLIDPATQAAAQTALNQGATIANGPGANTHQVQGSQQQGQFRTQQNQAANTAQTVNQVGTQSNDVTQTGTQDTTSTGATTGTAQTTGTQTQENLGAVTGSQQGSTSTTGQTSTSGTTRAVDDVGFGSALQSLLPGATQNDQARSAFLRDTMETGGTQFGSQVDQAIRNSLSGPQVTAAGDSARARMGGYAAAQVARNNMDQRLQAANQLAGPTGVGTMTQQGQSLTGQRTDGTTTSLGTQLSDLVNNQTSRNVSTGTSDSTTNTAGTSDNTTNVATGNVSRGNQTSTNFGETLSSMASGTDTAGTASGSSLGIATGQTPQQTSSGGGGCYVCSVYATKGACDKEDVRDAVKYKLRTVKSRWMPIGYSIYGPFLARLVLRNKLVERLLRPVALSILHEELRLAGKRQGLRLGAWAFHFAFHNGSAALGWVAHKLTGREVETKDEGIKTLLSNHNLYFQV